MLFLLCQERFECKNKRIYHFQALGRAGHPAAGRGVGVHREQWQAARGNLHPSSHRPAAILEASLTPGSEARPLASPEDTGARQGLSPEITSQPTPAQGSRALRPDELSPLSHQDSS